MLWGDHDGHAKLVENFTLRETHIILLLVSVKVLSSMLTVGIFKASIKRGKCTGFLLTSVKSQHYGESVTLSRW